MVDWAYLDVLVDSVSLMTLRCLPLGSFVAGGPTEAGRFNIMSSAKMASLRIRKRHGLNRRLGNALQSLKLEAAQHDSYRLPKASRPVLPTNTKTVISLSI